MSYAIAQDEPGGAASAALSVLVHVLLLAFLFFGVRWQTRHPDTVVVELWNALPALEQPQPAPRVEPRPEAKPEPGPEPKVEPRVEKAPQKPDIALEREKKPSKKQEPKKEEPKLKFDATQRIREQLAQEQQALTQTRERREALQAFAPPAAAIDAGYADEIRARIKANIVLPPGIKGNPEAVFDVVQLPSGNVLNVVLRKSSGLPVYDAAVERAIRKASPLPRPDRPELFQRNLTLKFRPLD